jgi:hypothetical protein
MILTNAKIFDSVQVLSQAKNETGPLGYAIMVNLRKLSAEVNEYAEKRNELLAKHGTDQGNGKYNFTPEQGAAFAEALRPYAEMEADVAVRQVPEEVFCSGGLTSWQMDVLSWMVKEE